MEQLASCYFCGAALDAQIEPYRVVPALLDPSDDEQRAVSLCPACRQKVGQIVDTVVAATDADDAAASIDDVPELDPEGRLLDDESVGPATGGDDHSRDPRGGSNGDGVAERDDRPGERQASRNQDTQTSQNQTIERTRSSHSEQGTGGGERRQHDSGRGQSGDPLDSGQRDANGTEQHRSGSDGTEDRQYSSGTRAGQRDASDRTQQSHGDDAAEDDGPSLTALEYNKVMRLLQNREFPVERAEIHEVATSAYDITDREFDAIIDAAIERGLIDEQNGQLVGGD